MRIVRRILLFVGLALLLFPVVSSWYHKSQQRSVISTYETETTHTDKTEKEAELKKARAYNNRLYQAQSTGIVVEPNEWLDGEDYHQLLNGNGTGMMGSIHIPKIDAEIPIYHGTSDDVLARAVGHLENTSLPVGGENTHSILSGHRGLPTAKLFTRLDELTNGDVFLLNVYGAKLAYRVCEIVTILPEETEVLQIQEGRDLVSLVTCTPYGINTHRLVITGERIDYTEATKLEVDVKPSISVREVAFTIIPLVVAVIVIGQSIWEYCKRKKRGQIYGKD